MQNQEQETDLMGLIEQTTSEGSEMLRHFLGALLDIWADMGVGALPNGRSSRCRTYLSHIKKLNEEMLNQELANKQVMLNNITSINKSIVVLCKELHEDIPSVPDGLPLYQLSERSQEVLEQLQSLKEDRLKKIRQILTEINNIKSSMQEPEMRCPESDITERKMLKLKEELKSIAAEKEARENVFLRTRETLSSIYKELGEAPNNTFAKAAVIQPVSDFKLSNPNMERLKDLHKTMEQRRIDAIETANELREKISCLWVRLEITQTEKEKFLSENPGHRISTIEALKKEFKRCQELKTKNIEMFIKQLRTELESWWDVCQLSEDERMSFLAGKKNVFTEEILESFEAEVTRLKEHFESNRDIYKLWAEHCELWTKLSDLDARALDSNRLFDNRGGKLLREGKERADVKKKLPRIRAELTTYLNEYFEEKQEPFFIDGQDLLLKLENMWQERTEAKENEIKQRKQNRENESRIGSRSANKTASSRRTPNDIWKLRSPRCPTSTVLSVPSQKFTNGKRKLLEDKSDEELSSTKSRRLSRTERRSRSGPRFSTGKKGKLHGNGLRNMKTRRNLNLKFPDQSKSRNDSVLPTYKDFQEDLEKLQSTTPCRSSVVPGISLRSRTPAKLTTPAVKLTTPGGVTRHLATPKRPPIVTPLGTRSSTRLNLRSPGKSPVNSSKLTTPLKKIPLFF